MLYVLIVILTIVAIVCLDHYTSIHLIKKGKEILENENSPYEVHHHNERYIVYSKSRDGYLRYYRGDYSWDGWRSDAKYFDNMDEVYIEISLL